ncbi:MAG: tRNA (adenosine(37)-N6)-threonylcarbamoyltransferase complex dimerization subunit type 1 TsaB [Gemmatimonadaceae bacterium]|nr:tRNA (adenosine(37)-N6)-threonylcarbamoyltransferase complex dimerization subunit type 1 TsaB [Gemmatimonadaceae bacterium]
MDGLSLALDAAVGEGTIAVIRDGALLAERRVTMRSEREERFLPAVIAALADAGVEPAALTRIVCGAGPGSFTSLRVVGAAAKGFAQGLDRPLFAVPSLALIVAADPRTAQGGRWLATLDAMRGDRYLALVTVAGDGQLERVESLGLAPAGEVAARAEALVASPIGPDAELQAAPHARGLLRAGALTLAAGPVDLAAWEPVYGRLAEAQVKWEAAHGRLLL